jgi:hypothetical protein
VAYTGLGRLHFGDQGNVNYSISAPILEGATHAFGVKGGGGTG